MPEKLYFHYQSPANIVRLMITILFEKTYSDRDISVYHKRFDHESDDIFQTFLEKLFPEGITVGETELNMLTAHTHQFMQTDLKSKELYAAYDKAMYPSWVYFKPDLTVYIAEFGDHTGIVKRLCLDYFKNFDYDEIKRIDMYKFILDNFEIRSNCTSIEDAAADHLYIQRYLLSGLND